MPLAAHSCATRSTTGTPATGTSSFGAPPVSASMVTKAMAAELVACRALALACDGDLERAERLGLAAHRPEEDASDDDDRVAHGPQALGHVVLDLALPLLDIHDLVPLAHGCDDLRPGLADLEATAAQLATVVDADRRLPAACEM